MTGTFPSLKGLGGHNTATQLEIGIPAAIAAAFLGPELLPAAGFGAEAAGAGAAAAGAGAPLDILAGGAAAGTAEPAALGTALGIGATGSPLAAGLATEPAFASSVPAGLDLGALGTPLAETPAPGSPAVAGLAPFSGVSPSAPGAGSALGFAPTNTAVVPNDPLNLVAGTSGPATGSADFATLGPGSAAGTTGSTGSDLLGGIGNFFKNNAGLLGLLGLGVGGQLASPAISKALGLNKVPGSENLNALAQREGQLAQQQTQFGQTAEQPLITGVLPPGQQQAVTNALNDAIATIKGRYASLGLSGSTMEAQAIADAQNRSVEVAGNLEQQMAQTGAQAVSTATNALGLESQIYDTILNATIQQDEQLGNAISNFASSAALGTAIGQARRAQ